MHQLPLISLMSNNKQELLQGESPKNQSPTLMSGFTVIPKRSEEGAQLDVGFGPHKFLEAKATDRN